MYPSHRASSFAPPRRRPLRALVAIVWMLALVFGGCALAAQGAGEQTWGAQPDEGARYLLLDDGRSGTVAVSSNETVKVWWRDRNHQEWSPAAEVDGSSGHYLEYTRARVLGNTLAIRAFYTNHRPGEESSAGKGTSTSRFILCRARVCTPSRFYTHVQDLACRTGSCRLSRPESEDLTQVPQLGSAGGQVYFGHTERGYSVWSAGEGLRELTPEGLPPVRRLSAPLLAPDGSMRVVAGRERDGACRLTLFTSDPIRKVGGDRIEFTRRTTTTAPTSTGRCRSTLEAFDSNQLVVHTDRDVPAYFERLGGVWQQATEDPTGMIRYDSASTRTAAGSVARTGYWHWREVVVGSPDGRELVAQVHFPGAPQWTVPKTVAVAPPGSTCRDVVPTSTPSQDPFYVTMTCRSLSSPDAAWFGVHAVSEDGYRWRSAIGDDSPARVGDDLWFGGSPAHRWTPDRGLVRVHLRVPEDGRTFLLDDGTLVLVTADPVGARCRLVVQVAEEGERRWSAPLPFADPLLPRTAACEAVGQGEGSHVVRLYVQTARGTINAGNVRRTDGEWNVQPGQ